MIISSPEALTNRFRECLIIFARYPEIGKVKTRLIPSLGAEATTKLYREMAEHTLAQARSLKSQRAIAIEVWFTGGSEAEMQAWLGNDLNYQVQSAGDLGDRLIYALQMAIAKGYKSVAIIGTDCPELDTNILDRAFRQLQEQEVVVGGANDGGYYLIGLRQFIPELFKEIPWSTSAVLATTVEVTQNLGLSIAYLPTLTDVDTAQDLGVWQKVKGITASNPKISIIIPTLNEAENLSSILKSQISSWQNVEVIVADGGSSDRTTQIAESLGAKVISGAIGKAAQMNLGAQIAQGDVFLFLHADTILPNDFEQLVRQVLGEPDVVAGAFDLTINGDSKGLRLVEWGVRWRSRIFQMPYGDQGIFLEASVFKSLGGFPDLPIMEDFELISRLKHKGKIAIAPASVITSDRRWRKLNVLRTTLINQAIIIGYFWGVAPEKLAHWYRKFT